MSILGGALIGPFNKLWFLNLHPFLLKKLLPKMIPTVFSRCSRLKYIATSIFFETFILAWPYNASFIFCNTMLENNGNLKLCMQESRNNIMQIMKAGWKIYPVSQIGVYLIPKNFRAFADSFIDLVWSTVISHIQNFKKKEKTKVWKRGFEWFSHNILF